MFGKLEKLLQIADPLLRSYQEHNRLLENYQCPVDRRIQQFINSYANDLEGYDLKSLHLPTNSLELDRVGLARLLSLPGDADIFESEIVCSYRIKQGVLHNPVNDRRTTQGSFHIAMGGLPIPADKKAIPKLVWANLLKEALNPPDSLKILPYTSHQQEEQRAKCWTSLLLRPMISPAVPGFSEEQTFECRFFAPASLVSNLDFVEAIFGNAGHAFFTENDAALDVKRWSGHTGCVILAPHLTKITKKSLGLPHISQATDRQKRDGMCYEKDTDLYNEGEAFKITTRNTDGVILTIIADNYFGYCKKEVKSQMTYATNLFGNCEEEHSGGAIAFPSYYLGDTFKLKDFHIDEEYSFKEMVARCKDRIILMEEKEYAIDKKFNDIFYLPEDAFFTLHGQTVSWSHSNGTKISLRLKPGITYMLPSGYRVEMIHEKSGYSLIGTVGYGIYCHKPSTISGGGKSEISKSISDAIITGPVIVADFVNDLKSVEELINKDYSKRFLDGNVKDVRPVLSLDRSLGSVVKLLTASEQYTEEYNNWLKTIPSYIKQLVFIVKSLYKESWEGKWKEKFSVDLVNGSFGNSLKYDLEPVIGHYMRVGFQENSWRTFELRKDFTPAYKIQTEDDMTSSVVVPVKHLQSKYLREKCTKGTSIKISKNTEFRLFQRPDDCIIRGYDKKCESDLATPNTFICNFEALTQSGVQDLVDDAIHFQNYTRPQREFLEKYAAEGAPSYCVASSNTRVVGPNQRSKNPRYLQNSEELVKPRKYYLSEVSTRLHQVLPSDVSVVYPVDAVISGRRNNPESKGVPPLCVHGPIHYLELPELFMEYISSMTGKSPSTTGACGSEGALTKGPFCPILSITELNTALVSMILTGSDGFFSSAGTLGPNYRVDHDISLLIPELWCRMRPEERSPKYLMDNELLEKVNDFEYKGQTINASRLGYRITQRFVRTFFGRLFTNPGSVFTDDMLKPETQGMDTFVKSLGVILDTYQSVALQYFEDNAIEGACPPLKAVLNVMAYGHFEGKSINDPEIRKLFTSESLLSSEWYKERLQTRQKVLTKHWERSKQYLVEFSKQQCYKDLSCKLGIDEKIKFVEQELAKVSAPGYVDDLVGYLGTDPFMYKEVKQDLNK